MSTLIPENELFSVNDSSKVQSYMNCPRRYFFEHVIGWRTDEPSIHLEFGTAVHLAMEILHTKGYEAESLSDAFEVFFDHYRKYFGEELDDANAPKNPANFMRALPLYAKKYRDIDAEDEVLHVEVAGSVAVGPNRLLYFKSDTIIKTKRGIIAREHKTGTRFHPLWAAQWRKKMQAAAYNHVLYCLFLGKDGVTEDDIAGVEINGIFLRNEPRLKRDGQPYANQQDTEFHRVPVRKNLPQMEAWVSEVNHWFDLIERDFSKLADAKEEDQVLDAFHGNTESCTKYGVCPFIDQCCSWPNPLQRMHELPAGFKSELWDPRDHSEDNVKEVIEL